MSLIKYGILTVSDSRSKGNASDLSGPLLESLIENKNDDIGKLLLGQVCFKAIVPDDEYSIKKQLNAWCKLGKIDVILTTGGTGISERDVTPEATKKVIDREIPGITFGMLATSLQITPMAMLSRAVCGVKNRVLIINLPGSQKAVKECLAAIAPVVTHAVSLIKNNVKNVTDVHLSMEATGGQTANACHSCPHKSSSGTSLNIEKVAVRSRESTYPMVSIEKALKMISDSVEATKSEKRCVTESYGRVLACDVHSKYDLPPFKASIKDGYAVIATDGKGRRKVIGASIAGNSGTLAIVKSGFCVRVNTGAPVPDGATAVVQVEDTKLIESSPDGMEELEIEIMSDVKDGQDIRPIGCDILKEELVVQKGTKLGAIELGLIEACGLNEVSVTVLPKIGVLSTGDELQKTGQPLLPGHIYDSNKITLLTILKEQGFGLHAIDVGIAHDNEEAMVKKIGDALTKVDILITTGSVSMGDRDMLKPVLQHYFNATIHFGRVNMKPGKPTTFGTCTFNGEKKYLLCLPGNPVSATVTMHLFVLPLLREISGDTSKPTVLNAMLTSSYNLDPRPEYARAILRWDDENPLPKVYTTGVQASSKLISCRNANAFIILPGRTPEKTVCCAGEIVQAMLFGFHQYN